MNQRVWTLIWLLASFCVYAVSMRHIHRVNAQEERSVEEDSTANENKKHKQPRVYVSNCPFNSLIECTDYETFEEALARIKNLLMLQQQLQRASHSSWSKLHQATSNANSRHGLKRIFIG